MGARRVPSSISCNHLRSALVLLGALVPGCASPVSDPIVDQSDLPPTTQSFEGVKPLADQPPEIVNSIGMTLKLVQPGKYTAGWPERDHPFYKEFGGPEHEVSISRPFYLAAHEVTQGQYKTVMGANPSIHSAESTYPGASTRFKDQDTSKWAADHVSWEDALEFCAKLSELPEEKAAGRVYTLPTEAQWEYACRAGSTTMFNTGETLTGNEANFNSLSPMPESEEKVEAVGSPTDVGSYAPNAWGLYDMHGNVQEWCLDPPHRYPESPLTDPTADGSKLDLRVIRGGSFEFDAHLSRSAARNALGKTARNHQTGFRVMIQQ